MLLRARPMPLRCTTRSVRSKRRSRTGRRPKPSLSRRWRSTLTPPPPILHLGITLAAEGRAPDAIRELTTASQLAPSNASAQLELGRALISAGQDDQAIPILQRAVELAPDFLDAKYQLALALQGTGQEQQSIPLFQQVVAAQPHNANALTNLALASGADGQIERWHSALSARACGVAKGPAHSSGPRRRLPAAERPR